MTDPAALAGNTPLPVGLPRYVAPPGAATVPLPFTDRLADAVAEMVAVAGSVVVDGPSGSGKSYTAALVCRQQPAPLCAIELGPRPGTAKVTRVIYQELTGEEAPRRATEVDRLTSQVLAEQPRILLIDEAQKLGENGIDQLIHLHQHPAAQFTLVLVGVRLGSILSRRPELESRFARSVIFDFLRDQSLLDWLAAYHPLLARTDPELLRRIDNRYWRGNLRRWAQMTHAAYNLLENPDTADITEEVAAAAIVAVRGARP